MSLCYIQMSETKTSNSDEHNDLYDNPMIRSAMNALSPEEQEQYKRVGRYMYGMNYNAENPKEEVEKNIVDTRNPEQILMQAESSIRSGLNPMELSEMEVYLLYIMRGRKWYEDFNYEKEEVPPIPPAPKLEMPKEMEMRLRLYKKRIIEEKTGMKYTKKK